MDPYFQNVVYVIFTSFVAFLAWAAINDVRAFVIPNWVVVCLALLFCVAALLLPFEIRWGSHLGALAAVFAAGLLAYRFKLMGAGDVKMLSALALWAGFENLPMLLLYVALAGGAMAIVLVAVRKAILGLVYAFPRLVKVMRPRVLSVGESIPYGVAIAAGGIAVGFKIPQLGLFI